MQNESLYSAIRNTKRLLNRSNVSWLAKFQARQKLVRKAIHAFERAGKFSSLPSAANSKVLEKLFNAANAVSRQRFYARQNQENQQIAAERAAINRLIRGSPKTYTTNVPSFRNASMTKNKNGNPVVIYFPNN
jgi:hypothetical protein